MSIKRRSCLRHDWEQGDYIDGGVLEGRINWDSMDEMEQHAMGLIEEWVEELDNVNLGWSGGIDSLVLLHMVYRLGLQDEVPAVTAITPEYYPSVEEYSKGMADRLNFDHHVLVTEYMDMDWLVNNPKQVFPDFWTKQGQMDRGFRARFREYFDENDSDLSIWGNRNESNDTPHYVWIPDQRFSNAYEGDPIRTWHVNHVIAYCDRYNLPISPGYHASETSGGGPWHRRCSTHNGEVLEEEERAWFRVRRMLLNFGYTEKWEHIIENFPDAETKAVEWAVQEDLEFPEIEEGYNRGCDVRPNPPLVGPET